MGPRSRTTLMTATLAITALLLAACGETTEDSDDPGTAGDTDAVTLPQSEADSEVAWTHHGEVESTLDADAAVEAIEDTEALNDAWDQHQFEGEPPEVAFDDEVVLLVRNPDNACPNQPVELEVNDQGYLDIKWVAPPGACEDPLIIWLHALTVHRGALAEEFTYGPSEPHEDALETTTVELPPYDGDAPPAPTLEDLDQEAMTEEEVDAVFADHPVQQCGPEHEPFRDNTVDGELSDDPEVADGQQGRAGFGLPSDEESTRAAIDADESVDGMALADTYGFPVTEDELEASQDVESLTSQARNVLEDEGIDTTVDAMPLIARADGIQATVATDEEHEDEVRALLDAEFGEDTVVVEVVPWSGRDVADAQEALSELMGNGADGDDGRIASLSGQPGPVNVGMVDPTVEALDAIAELVDPELVCVNVERGGVGTLEGGAAVSNDAVSDDAVAENEMIDEPSE